MYRVELLELSDAVQEAGRPPAANLTTLWACAPIERPCHLAAKLQGAHKMAHYPNDQHPYGNSTSGTSLDPTETPEPNDPYQPQTSQQPDFELEQQFRHSGWAHRRNQVWRALNSCQVSKSRLERFAGCGTRAWVVRDSERPDRVRVLADYCRDRWCGPCGAARSSVIADNLRSVIEDRPCRFITLTLRATDQSLRHRLEHLYSSFRRLRRLPTWRDNVVGGAAFTEVVWSPKSQAWHTHLHILAIGKFLPHDELSAAWLKATGDSYIVDVRLVRGHEHALRYVTKYATKPLSPDTVDDHARLCEAITALQGRRLVLTFGAWARVKLTATPSGTEWQIVGRLCEVIRLASQGVAWAVHVLAKLRRHPTCPETHNLPAERAPLLPGFG